MPTNRCGQINKPQHKFHDHAQANFVQFINLYGQKMKFFKQLKQFFLGNRTVTALTGALSVSLLASCAYDWHHPTKGKEAFYADEEQCEFKAMQLYPQVITPQQKSGGYTTPGSTKCDGKNCTTIPGTYVGPEFEMVDINKQNRSAAVYRCLQAQGWHLQKRQ